MKLTIAHLAIIVVVISYDASRCDASPSNPNGAIHARVTANGLNYINQELKKQLDEKVNRIRIPMISGNKNRVSYEVKNIRIERIVPGPSSIQATSGGFRWQLSFSEIRVRADWWFRFKKGWVKISDDGHATATVKNLRFDVTLKPRVGSDGKLAVIPASVIPNNCARVSDVDVRIGGSFWSWLYNLLINLFEKKLREIIPREVCKEAGKAVEKWSREVFPNMQLSDTIEILGENFLADYGLVNPEFSNGLANIRFLGEVLPLPKTFDSFPFSPSPMPSTPRSKHVYVVISDFVANTLLYSVKQKGLIRQTFSASDDTEIRDLLGNVCKGLPIGVDEGSPGGSNDCADLDFSFDVLETPTLTFSKANGVSLQLNKAEVHVQSTDGGQKKDLLKIHISIKVSAQPNLSPDGRRLHFIFASPVVNFDLIEPSIPADIEQQTRNFVRMAGARYGRRALNKFGAKGVELPNVRGKVDIVNRELLVEDGALVVAANLKSNF